MKPIGNSPHTATTRKRNTNQTCERLISSARALVRDYLPEDISTDMVIENSGVSRGSLYYHFEDLGDLVETALIRAFSETVDSNIAMMVKLLYESNSRYEFYQATALLTTVSQSSERYDSRFERVRLLGFAYKNPRLAAKLDKEQARLTDAYTNLFREAQIRGWMSDDFNPRTGAIMIQAYTLGKIVDDVTSEHMDPTEWADLIMKIVARVFGASPGNLEPPDTQRLRAVEEENAELKRLLADAMKENSALKDLITKNQ